LIHQFFNNKFDFGRYKQLFLSQNINEEMTVLYSEMSEDLYPFLKQLAIDSIKSSNEWHDVTTKLKDTLSIKFESNWNCFIHKENFGMSSVAYVFGKYVKFSISDIVFIVFQT
jgi:hypothetical protein